MFIFTNYANMLIVILIIFIKGEPEFIGTKDKLRFVYTHIYGERNNGKVTAKYLF